MYRNRISGVGDRLGADDAAESILFVDYVLIIHKVEGFESCVNPD